MRRIKIGTRKSRLACIQAEIVAEYIRNLREPCGDWEESRQPYPQGQHQETRCGAYYQAELVKVITTGDRILNKRLDEIGSKGVFVKELDIALEKGETDLSVHSLKDMPMEISDELPIIGYSRREDPRDVLVLPKGVAEYDGHSPIGSSSNRRILQLRELFPKAEIKTVRGNVLTRLEKLEGGEYGALVLAAAGLKRLGLEDRISRYFSAEEMIPAAGQGILGVQGRKGVDYGFLAGFFDEESRICALAERGFMRYLNGGCSLPVGVYAEILDEKQMRVRGLYCEGMDGAANKMCITGNREEPEALGIRLAKALKERCRTEGNGQGTG